MCLMLDQFLWGHSSRDCDISCLKNVFLKKSTDNKVNPQKIPSIQKADFYQWKGVIFAFELLKLVIVF